MSWREECPLCHKDIWVSKGQRVIGCGDCRSEIRKHNRKVAKKLHAKGKEIPKAN